MQQLTSSDITPESVYLNRRKFMKTAGFGALAGLINPLTLFSQTETGIIGEQLRDELTRFQAITHYNNFYGY